LSQLIGSKNYFLAAFFAFLAGFAAFTGAGGGASGTTSAAGAVGASTTGAAAGATTSSAFLSAHELTNPSIDTTATAKILLVKQSIKNLTKLIFEPKSRQKIEAT
jgi:hypothetical protein